MAKKNTPGSNPSNGSTSPRRRTTTRRAASATAVPAGAEGLSVADVTTVATAAEMSALTADVPEHPGSADGPSYHEIAVAAYLRYLERGGHDGRDFDDWIEAETALKRLSIR
jgi:hypothetical protein